MRSILVALVCCLAASSIHGQRLVSHFKPVALATPGMNSCETDASGNIYVSGYFHFVNRKLTGGLVKLKPDGSVDESFFVKPGTTAKKAYPIANGKVYMIGQYRLPDGAVTVLVRLNADGTHDPSFVSGITSGVADLVVQSSGKVVVIGIFQHIPVPGYPALARLNADGSMDDTFGKHNILTQQFGKGVAVDKDDNIYVTDFTKVLKLNPNGVEEVSYTGAGSDPQYRVEGVTALASGKVLVHGGFTKFNGVDTKGLVRLNIDGTVDQTFSFAGAGNSLPQGDIITELSNGNLLLVPGSAYNSGFLELQANGALVRHAIAGNRVNTAAESNGGVVAVGGFETLNGFISNTNIARIKSTGEPDVSFVVTQVFAASNDLPMLVDSQDRVLVGGTAPPTGVLNNGTYTEGAIQRLVPTGDRDITFVPATQSNSNFWSGYIQGDGKYVLGGLFYGPSPIPILLRLNADGTMDNSFTRGTTTSSQGRIVKFSGNNIYITGQWAQYNGTITGGFIRLTADGSIAQTYTAWQQFGIGRAFEVLQDGRVLFSGSRPTSEEVLIRFNTDGTLDSTFPTLTFAGGNARAMAVDANGFAYIGGRFNSIGSIVSPNLVKLQADGTQAPNFSTGTGFMGGSVLIYALQILPNGNIAVGGAFTGYQGVSANGFVVIDPTGAVVPTPNISFGPESFIQKFHWRDDALYVSGLLWNPGQTELSSFRKISFATGTPPASPDNLTISLAAGGVFDISWADKSSDEEAFVLERSTSPTSGFVTVKTLPSNTTSVKDSFLTHEQVYYYRVRASGDTGESGYSNVASMTMLVLGVEHETSFSIYPNPAHDFIIAKTVDRGTWDLISSTGAVTSLHADYTNEDAIIDLRGVTSGVYVLKYSSAIGTLTKRIAVIK